jgi:hypothetical protein
MTNETVPIIAREEDHACAPGLTPLALVEACPRALVACPRAFSPGAGTRRFALLFEPARLQNGAGAYLAGIYFFSPRYSPEWIPAKATPG